MPSAISDGSINVNFAETPRHNDGWCIKMVYCKQLFVAKRYRNETKLAEK